VNGPEPLIADALREIAAEAPTPRPMADTAWQAGRRRRLSRVSTAASAGAGAIAAAIALPLAMAGSPGQSPSVLTGPTLPVSLTMPIKFRQVAAISIGACPSGSGGLSGPVTSSGTNPAQFISKTACYRFTSKGMTVTGLKSAVVVNQPGGGYLLDITFRPGDATRFAALTRELAGQPSPHCQLAAIVGGHVMSAPIVEQPITQGQAQINGFGSRAQAERLLHQG
jgi:preprotein translocase subunit SecD